MAADKPGEQDSGKLLVPNRGPYFGVLMHHNYRDPSKGVSHTLFCPRLWW
jgi:hypothetical protein